MAIYHAFSGQREEAVAQTQRMLEIAPSDPSTHYYDALIKWHHGEAEATYQAIKSSLELGMSPVFIVTDPTLAPLRKETRFQTLVASYEN